MTLFCRLSEILGEMEQERKVTFNPLSGGSSGSGSGLLLPRDKSSKMKSNVDMTLTLTRGIEQKPSNRALMRVLSRKT